VKKFWDFAGAGERTLYLNGPIAENTWFGDEITPAAFKADLDSGAGDLTVWINSEGGDVFAAARIYTMLREYSQSGKGRVTVKIEGVAASAASVVAMAGDQTLMSPVSYIIIHNPMTGAFGDSEDMLRAKEMLDEIKEGIINAYEAKTGLSRTKVSHMMDAEKCMNAYEAVDLGFADGILYSDDNILLGSKATKKFNILAGGVFMSTAMELKEKRTQTWNAAKAFFASKQGADGLLSAEDTLVYDKMEADVNAMSEVIDRMERQEILDQKFSTILNTPVNAYQQPVVKKIGDSVAVSGRASDEYRRAFWATFRNPKSEHDPVIYNALSIGTETEGGYLVPNEFERTLISALEDFNIMRRLARTVSTASGELQVPVVATRGTAAWIEEAELIPESDGSFGQVTLKAHKMATVLKVSHELLSDAAFPLESFVANDFARRLGALEEEAFISGDGDKKPMGVLNDAIVGHTAASPTAITFDDVIKLFYSLRTPYRGQAAFVTNEQTVMALRKLKDESGQYLWMPSLTEGTPQTILGRPVYVSVFMPTMEADAKTLLFGDFSYYWIADRQGRSFERLNELFSMTDQIGFKATQRVDGRLILPEAVKVLQMGS